MTYPREEVQATVDRYHATRDRIERGLEADDFGALADFYTDDAVYIDAAWGRIEGKAAIARWLVESMVGLDDWRFPVEFTAIEGDNVVVKWTQVTPGKKADGSPFTQSGYSHLVYAGDGRFSYEEDCYNMVHVLEDLSASGWRPTEPMNLPPERPVRAWGRGS
jgi:ketosteroid isomerase-like protein